MKLAALSTISLAALCAFAGCAHHDHADHAHHAHHAGHNPSVTATTLGAGTSSARGQAAMPEMQLPPGWTQEDMVAYGAAATPGEEHAMLMSHVGTWKGTNTMWMAPGAPEMTTESSCVTTAAMDGRFTIMQYKGEMPGMGPFQGMGVMGFDNVSKKFVSAWMDNQGTGMMRGVGTLSADKKTLTTVYTYNCPITKGPVTMREVDTFPDSNTMIMEMYATDPKVKVEYKCMRIVLKRVG
jgi:hypothetical protein